MGEYGDDRRRRRTGGVAGRMPAVPEALNVSEIIRRFFTHVSRFGRFRDKPAPGIRYI